MKGSDKVSKGDDSEKGSEEGFEEGRRFLRRFWQSLCAKFLKVSFLGEKD